MTVAEVPRQSRQRRGIFDAHFEERFGFRDDLYNAAIVKQQRVVSAKAHGFRKIKFDASAFHTEEKSALRLALRERKNERVDDAAGLAIGGRNKLRGARHDGLLRCFQFSRAGRSGSSLAGADVGASAGALSPSARPSVGAGTALRSYSR